MNSEKKKQFKAQAHLLKPVIIVGQAGLTESVLKEIEITLDTHELIKIKIRADKEHRNQICDQIITESKAELIQSIGQVIVIYRKKPEAKKIKTTGPRQR
ncbi:MAG: ribosome assembly RNA-binding protein YhbY [Methylococcales bacterium]|nr:ribosome assembly RNA-binding protein YhbY [Methylococcales bacterium]